MVENQNNSDPNSPHHAILRERTTLRLQNKTTVQPGRTGNDDRRDKGSSLSYIVESEATNKDSAGIKPGHCHPSPKIILQGM